MFVELRDPYSVLDRLQDSFNGSMYSRLSTNQFGESGITTLVGGVTSAVNQDPLTQTPYTNNKQVI